METKEINKSDEIAAYLGELDFKKKFFGGCDKEDVLNKYMKLTQMYEERLDKIREQERTAQQAKDEADFELQELRERRTVLQNENEELQRKVESLLEEKKAHEERARQIADLEFRQKLERSDALLKAEREARYIKERAQQDAVTMREKGRAHLVEEIKKKRELLERLNTEVNDQICDIRAVLRVTDEEFIKMHDVIGGLEERLRSYTPTTFFLESEENEGEMKYVEESVR